MALYDDGGVQFAQERMDEAKAFKIQQAKKQEKFAKKLTVFDGAVKGLNYLVNAAADKAEQNQSFKKASYETMMKRAEAVRLQDAERIKTGVSQLDYLTTNIYNQLITQIEEDAPLADISLAKRAFRQEAKKLAQTKLPEYKTMIDTANNFGSFEDFEEEYSKASEIPRSIFGWMTSGVKNVVRGETDESIEYKAKKSKDALYGTDLFDKFANLEKSFTAYDARTNSPLNVEEILKKAEEDELIKGKIFKEGVKVITDVKSSRGVTKSTDILVIPRFDPKTNDIVSNPATNITLNSTVTRDKDGYLNADDINKDFLDKVKPEARDIISALLFKGGAGAKVENGDTALQWMAENPDMMAVDWSDESNMAKAFPTWYSTQIKYAGFYNEENKWQSISKQNRITKEWEINEDYRPKAVELGLDEKSAYETFTNMGSSATLGTSTFSNADDALTFGNLIDDNYEDITKNLTQQQATAWNDIEKNDWYDIFQKQIDAGKEAYEKDPTSSTRMTKLAEDLDFTQAFNGLDLTGNYSVYLDNKTNKIYIKKI